MSCDIDLKAMKGEFKKLIDESMKQKVEIALNICSNGTSEFQWEEKATGDEKSVRPPSCPVGSKSIGVHTHPSYESAAAPSQDDIIIDFIKLERTGEAPCSCITSPRGVACYEII